MIKAKEAALKSGPLCNEYLAEIEKLILKACGERKRLIIIRDKPYCYWMYSPIVKSNEELKALKELENLGYKVSEHYEERQFVDIGLIIKW